MNFDEIYEVVPLSQTVDPSLSLNEYSSLVNLHLNGFSTSPFWLIIFPPNTTTTEKSLTPIRWIMSQRVLLTKENIFILQKRNQDLKNEILGCVTMELKKKRKTKINFLITIRNSFLSLQFFFLKLFEFISLFGFFELLKLFINLLKLGYQFLISSTIKSKNQSIHLTENYWSLSCYTLHQSVRGQKIGEFFLSRVYNLLNITHQQTQQSIILHTLHPKLVQYYEELGYNLIQTNVIKDLNHQITPISYTLIKVFN